MRRWILFVLLLAALLPGFTARAQGTVIRFSKAEVALWPEYDEPSVLVIQRLTLAADVALPATLSLRVPLTATINAVATRDAGGQLIDNPYTQAERGGWLYVELTTPLADIQLEYYDSGLNVASEARAFNYQWPGDYAADSLIVEVQQPYGASDLTISPSPVTSSTGSDGLTYYLKDVGALLAGQLVELQVNYNKTSSDQLTVDFLTVQPSQPLADVPPAQNQLLNLAPWLLGVLGVGLMGAAVYWYWRTTPRTGKRKQRSRGPKKTGATESAPASGGDGVYCHQCGKRAGPGDRFCRTCGARLRIEE